MSGIVIPPEFNEEFEKNMYLTKPDKTKLVKVHLPPAPDSVRVMCTDGVERVIPAKVVPYSEILVDATTDADNEDLIVPVAAESSVLDDAIVYMTHYIDNRDDYPANGDMEKYPIPDWDETYAGSDLHRIVPLHNVANFMGFKPLYTLLCDVQAKLWANKTPEEIVALYANVKPYYPDAIDKEEDEDMKST